MCIYTMFEKIICHRQCHDNNLRRYGFFMNNVISLNSELEIPENKFASCIARYGYVNNQVASNDNIVLTKMYIT